MEGSLCALCGALHYLIPSTVKIRPTVIDKSKAIEPTGSKLRYLIIILPMHGSPDGITLPREGKSEQR